MFTRPGSRRWRCWVSLLVLLPLVASCAHKPQRVSLTPAPPDGAALEAREGFYGAHGPLAVQTSTSSVDASWFGPIPSLVLRDGVMVEHSADLLPTLHGDSETSRHAGEAESAEKAARAWRITAASMGVSGVAAAFGGVLLPAAFPVRTTDIAAEPSALGAIALVSVGSALTFGALIPALFARSETSTSLRAHEAAFRAYGTSLRDGLNLAATNIEHAAPASANE